MKWWRIFFSTFFTAVLLASLASRASADANKWELMPPAPTPFLDVMLLMPDGSVMMLSADDNQTWVKLTPDIYGSYVNGTWSTVGKMNIPRLYFASQVLPDGRLWVTGGEYTGPYYDQNITGSGEIYDPATNKWTWTANFPICQPATATNPTGARTVNVTSDVVLTSGSPIVTGIYSTDRIRAGWTISGGGFPSGTTVVSVDSPTQVTVSQAATASGPTTVGFRGRTTTCVGDEPSALLPGGNNILVGGIFAPTPYIYSLSANTWTPAATKVNSDRSDEEGWATLDDGRILNYDLFTSVSNNNGNAELYNPTTNAWTDISPAHGTANGTLPVLTSAALGFELGPPLRLQDGRLMVVGANEHTAIYTPSTNTWAAGPDMIGSIPNAYGTINNAKFGADDAPAAALPNGHLIIGADPGPNPVVLSGTTVAGSNVVTGIPSTAGLQVSWSVSGAALNSGARIRSVDSPTQVTLTRTAKTTTTSNLTFGGVFSSYMLLFDFNPNNGKMTPMNAPDPNLPFISSYYTRMLVLPTGQLMFNDSSNQPWVYTPQGAPLDSALPVITGVVANGGGTYTLTGTQLNGQSAGAAYGDDAQMNENYPIVRLQTAMPNNAICNPNAANCRVYYARTSNWSSVAVGGGTTPEAVNFTLPAGIPSGQYLLTVTGAGISSAPVPFNVP